MTKTNPTTDVEYPQPSEEWRKWIEFHLGIDDSQGRKWAQENKFPFERLVEIWNELFRSKNGYSPSFIPALTRNKNGFVKWVYCSGPEPNWTKSDSV